MFSRFLSLASPSSLSLSRVLFGLSRSLQIAKNIVPIYQQISPLIKRMPDLVNKIPIFKNNNSRLNMNLSNFYSNNNTYDNLQTSKYGPTFFR